MLPTAARYANTQATVAGFSVPGIEVTQRPCGPIANGDVGRARWVNRQDHLSMTHVNMSRQQQGCVRYGCPERGLHCQYPSNMRTEPYSYAGNQSRARKVFKAAAKRKKKARAVAGRKRRLWGNGGPTTESPIEYIGMTGQDVVRDELNRHR